MKDITLNKLVEKGWIILKTGSGITIMLKNLILIDKSIRCIGVSNGNIIIFKSAYNSSWNFFETGAISITNINSKELERYFSKKCIEEVIDVVEMTRKISASSNDEGSIKKKAV